MPSQVKPLFSGRNSQPEVVVIDENQEDKLLRDLETKVDEMFNDMEV